MEAIQTTQPIHLIIDTSVLSANAYYKSQGYKSLKILIDKGLLKIYLPYIIENEYIEQLKKPYLEQFDSIKDSLETLKNRLLINTEEITNIKESINIVKNNTIEHIIKDFETNFCTKLRIKKLDIKPHHAEEVFKKYFKGLPPFKGKKNRKDIPDAFIFECIRDIKNKESNTVVLVADNGLYDACDKINITVFKNIEDFIKHEKIQDMLTDHINPSIFVDHLKSNKNIENFLTNYHVKELENVTITSHHIPSDDNSAQIIGIYTPENIECDFSKLIYYGNKKIGVPVVFNIMVAVDLFIFKGDYYAEDYGFSCIEDWNDHYFRTESEYLLKVESIVIIDISQIDFSASDVDFGEIFDKDDIFSLNDISNIEVIK